MQFVQDFSNMKQSPRPSMLGQLIPPIPQPIQGMLGDGSTSWLHVTPAHMPWGIPTANQPPIVRFTAESPPNNMIGNQQLQDQASCSSGTFQFKRKLDSEFEMPAMKQLITEERMASRLSNLHIGSDFTPRSPAPAAPRASAGEEERQQLKRLVLCEEIRRLKNEPVLPSSLLCKLEKPSMALVLWQPPAGSLGDLLGQAVGEGSQDEARNLDNNNSSAVDLNAFNGYLEAPGSSSGAEQMDL